MRRLGRYREGIFAQCHTLGYHLLSPKKGHKACLINHLSFLFQMNPWVNQLPMTVTKYLRLSVYKEERFILTHSSGGSLPWLIDSLLWACGEAEHHGGSTWRKRPLTS
jgi:hypothetical protein